MKYLTKLFAAICLFLFTTLVGNAQHKNIQISSTNFPNETSIIFDPLHPNYMVAGANLNNYYVSSDSGKTWSSFALSSPKYGVWGDPAMTVDAFGNFYFFHLSNPGPEVGSWVDRIVSQKSTNHGYNYGQDSFTGLNGTKVQDKHWVTVDRKTNTIYVTWTQFDAYNSSASTDSSHILFSKSTDGALTWSAPVRLDKSGGDCLDDDNTVEGAVPAVGPNGEIFVAWAGPQGIMFDKSTDGGQTWMPNDLHVTDMPGGWAYDIPGIYRANGMPITICDTSQTATRGNLYINWSDQRNGVNDTDVWLVKSTDGGKTWSSRKRVNNDGTGRQQFFTWMSVDQKTGYIYIVFYDRRAYSDTNTDVYIAFSKDGGETFSNQRISSSPFVPNSTIFFGDYTNIVAYNNIVRPIWTRLHNNELSAWTALVDVDGLITGIGENVPASELEAIYPNPSANETFVSFKLHQSEIITLTVSDSYGHEVKRIVDHVEYPYGKYVIQVSVNDPALTNGVYFYTFTIGKKSVTKRMVIMK